MASHASDLPLDNPAMTEAWLRSFAALSRSKKLQDSDQDKQVTDLFLAKAGVNAANSDTSVAIGWALYNKRQLNTVRRTSRAGVMDNSRPTTSAPVVAAAAAAAAQELGNGSRHSQRRGFSAPGRILPSPRAPAPITYDYRVVMASHLATRFTLPLQPRQQQQQQQQQLQLRELQPRDHKRQLMPTVRGTKKSEDQRDRVRGGVGRASGDDHDDAAQGATKTTVTIRYTEPRLTETREAARRGMSNNGNNSVNSGCVAETSLKRYRFTEDFVPIRVYALLTPAMATTVAAGAASGGGAGTHGAKVGRRRHQRSKAQIGK